MNSWHVSVVVLLVVSAALSVAAATNWAFSMRANGQPLTERNVMLLYTVCVGAVAWAFMARKNKTRLLDLTLVHLQWVFQGLVALVAFAYMNLRMGSFVSQQIHSHAGWVVMLASLLDFTGIVTYTIQCLPSHATCLHLLAHPFAILLLTCILSYYCAVANLWAELTFPMPDPKQKTTTTTPTAVQSGHQTQTAIQTLSAYNAASRARSSLPSCSRSASSSSPTYTVADSFSAQSPSTITGSTVSVAKAVLYTAVTVGNKVLSNEPIFSPAPIMKTLSVNARNLSSEPILSGRVFEVASLATAENDLVSTLVQSKQAISEVTNSDAAATSDNKVSSMKVSVPVEISSSEPKQHAEAGKSALLDHTTTKPATIDAKMPSNTVMVAVENSSSEPKRHADAGKNVMLDHHIVETVIIRAQAGGDDQLPAVATRMRRSSSLKAAWDKVLVPVKATKKSLAAASFIRKKSIQRTASSSADTTAANPTPSPTPVNGPRRTSSLKKTMSGLQSKLSPANCFGKGTVQM